MEAYFRAIEIGGNTIRVKVEGHSVTVSHNGTWMASKQGELATLYFKVQEGEEQVTYDLVVMQTGYTRIFLGRNGLLVFSDDETFSARPPTGQ